MRDLTVVVDLEQMHLLWRGQASISPGAAAPAELALLELRETLNQQSSVSSGPYTLALIRNMTVQLLGRVGSVGSPLEPADVRSVAAGIAPRVCKQLQTEPRRLLATACLDCRFSTRHTHRK